MPGPRVALVYDVLYPWVRGGAEKRLWEIARRLPAHGFEPHLIGPQYWDGPRSLKREGVWTHGICPPRPLYNADGTRTLSEALLFARDLLPALLRLRVDLIDCCAFPYFPWFSARAVASLRGIPLLTTWPELWGPYWLSYLGRGKGTVARGIESAVVHLGHNHLCPSPFTEGRLRAALHGRGTISPIPAGIDARELARYAAPLERRHDIIFIGRLLRHKRVADLLQALAIVRQTYPAAHLTIVGDGPEKATLQATISRLNLQDRVTFRADLDDDQLYTLLGQSRCLVLPSEREGQGMVIAEAQGTGTPPIVAKGAETAAPDFVEHGTSGLVYPAGEIPALAAGIVALLTDDTCYNQLAQGAQKAATALDWDGAILPRVSALYQSLLSRDGPCET